MDTLIPMKNRSAIALFAFLSILIFAPYHAPAQEASDSGRKIVARVMPQYPGLARSMRIEGTVRADVLVAASGKVTAIEVKGGHPLLVQAAQDALHQWKWEPAAHESHINVELKFTP
jgi:TonB family protein